MWSCEPYISIRFYVNTVSHSCENYCSLVVNLYVAFKIVTLIEPTREHTPGRTIISVNAFSQCMSDIMLYATTIRAL